jgi:ABC-2 type transport system permease protein
VSVPGSVGWLARHELRLAWREWLSLMTAGRPRRARRVAVVLLAAALLMHLIADHMVGPYAATAAFDKETLVAITATMLLSWSLLLSQAMESVTRAFYARADLDLVLSSPLRATRLFAVRIGAMTLAIAAMSLLLSAPFIDMLALRGGARWLAGFGVVAALGAVAMAVALAITVALFRTLGPKRTRFVAQLVAAVIGAAFVIGLQIAAILSYGTMSRTAVLRSGTMLRLVPDADSILWWPARAVLGDLWALAAAFLASALLLGGAILVFAPRFGSDALAASGAAVGTLRRERPTRFRFSSPAATLRHKEWTLLQRDPWLVSQTLMQLLYLLPPAVLLWRSFAAGGDGTTLLVPVLVMAAGQLAGGLAWLAVSGEDAPDLVGTAPILGRQILRAKIEAVGGGLALVFGPFLLVLALLSPWSALVALCGIAAAGGAATVIQLWFRTQAKRSHFRRRQVSSRLATIAEALSSIAWAATGALAANFLWLAAFPALFALLILAGTRRLSPAA